MLLSSAEFLQPPRISRGKPLIYVIMPLRWLILLWLFSKKKYQGLLKTKLVLFLMEMMQYIEEHNNKKKVLCRELSRLRRYTIEVLKTIELFNLHKIPL